MISSVMKAVNLQAMTFCSNWRQTGLAEENTNWGLAGNYIFTYHSCLVSVHNIEYLIMGIRCIYVSPITILCLLYVVGGDASLSSQLFPCLSSSLREGDSRSSTQKLNDLMEEFLESSARTNGNLGCFQSF